MRVLTGQITLVELEKELADIYCREWPWQIRELEPGNFLVRFLPHKKISDIKNYPSFGLRKAGVQVEVLEWVGDTEPMGELQEVWVQIRGIPPEMVRLESSCTDYFKFWHNVGCGLAYNL